ncbi:hypothetical protein HN011_001295 [Eciton burchellii]|nr:hypothetical protein HN011_001295 [Eciton burchellii]
MLAFAVRGVILFGVLGWYSVAVWRVIDGYFQDQFRAYLRDEYRQHPRMRADLESARNVDKGPDALPAEPSPSCGIEEIYGPDAATRRARTTTTKTTTPADIADACRAATGRKPEEQVAGGTSENAVAVRADKNAFPKSAARSALQSRKPPSSSVHDEAGQPSTINQDADREQGTTEGRSEVVLALSPRCWREAGSQGGSGTRGVPSGMSRQRMPRKRGADAIVLTNDADFTGASIYDNDFSEFEEEEEDGESREFLKEGILVSELPFKPKADIGNLDRITAEEFCPLTSDDEASCEEVTAWP